MDESAAQEDDRPSVRPLLTVSIVTFKSDPDELARTLSSLSAALSGFDPADVAITVIDNSLEDRISAFLLERLAGWRTQFLHGHGNVGFGRGHNLALGQAGRFHLILNPDIEMEPDALRVCLDFMLAQPQCGLLTPKATWPDGTRQYLCKRYPAAFDLMLRGFAPAGIRQFFAGRLARYEMQAETQDHVYWGPPIASGCFMLFRGDVLKALGGFDPGYMLYFEDFDLSLRAGRLAQTAYVPQVRIVHAGGHAARKGFWHIRQFARSGLRFYRKHGLKLF